MCTCCCDFDNCNEDELKCLKCKIKLYFLRNFFCFQINRIKGCLFFFVNYFFMFYLRFQCNKGEKDDFDFIVFLLCVNKKKCFQVVFFGLSLFLFLLSLNLLEFKTIFNRTRTKLFQYTLINQNNKSLKFILQFLKQPDSMMTQIKWGVHPLKLLNSVKLYVHPY